MFWEKKGKKRELTLSSPWAKSDTSFSANAVSPSAKLREKSSASFCAFSDRACALTTSRKREADTDADDDDDKASSREVAEVSAAAAEAADLRTESARACSSAARVLVTAAVSSSASRS